MVERLCQQLNTREDAEGKKAHIVCAPPSPLPVLDVLIVPVANAPITPAKVAIVSTAVRTMHAAVGLFHAGLLFNGCTRVDEVWCLIQTSFPDFIFLGVPGCGPRRTSIVLNCVACMNSSDNSGGGAGSFSITIGAAGARAERFMLNKDMIQHLSRRGLLVNG